MLDNRFVTAHDWALASDGMQWILLHNHRQDGTGRWQAVSFVHSTRDILARCMREKGCRPRRRPPTSERLALDLQ